MIQTVLLGDVCLQITDGTHSTVKDNADGEYLLLSAKNIKDRIVTSSNERKINKETLESLRKRTKTAKNDVLVTSVGTIGETAIIQDDEPNYEFQRSVLMLKPDTSLVNPQYLYYFMRMLKPQFISMATGAVQKCLFIGQMKSVQIELPDRETQKKIADILGRIDEKIELNRQMNETLEQMGQALFRHYFVDNPEAEKWKSGTISDLGEVITGKTPSKSKVEYYGNDVMFLKVPDMHSQSIIIRTEDNLSVTGADTQPKKYIPKWSTCVSCIATVGVVSLAGDTLQTNQQINSVVPKSEEYTIFNYYVLKSKSELLKTMASGGSATPNLNKGHFEKVSVTLPSDETLKEFHNEAKVVLEMVYENTQQIQTLTTLRNTLLPRLINGKVKV